MKTQTQLRLSIPTLVLLLASLLIGPAAGVRAQDGGLTSEAATLELAAPATALGTAFTYQGQLKEGSNPANGAYDFQFKLFDALSGGAQVGSTVVKNDLAVSGGLFTTELDFGAAAFDGQARWLQVEVRPGASTGAYTALTPRRALLASPYALFSSSTRGITVGRDGNIGIPNYPQPGFALDVTGAVKAKMLLLNGMAQILPQDNNDLRISALPNQNHLIIKAGGNVGIGTADPTAHLEVLNGTLRVSGSSALGQDSARLVVDTGASYGHNPLELRNDKNGILFKVFGDGRAQTKVLQITGGADLAERFQQTGDALAEPGTVMVIDPANPGHLTVSQTAYDTRVAGIVSGAGDVKPGLTLSQQGVMEGNLTVAMAGRVHARCEAISGPIQPGDLLTTSDLAGHCMKAADRERRDGAILGKAMTGLAEGTGLVLVLVNLQ